MKRVRALAGAALRTRGDAVDADRHARDRWGHTVTQHQSERSGDLPQATGPIRLDLPVFDSFGTGDDLCEPFSLDRCGDDVQRMLPRSLGHRLDRSFAIENAFAAWIRGLIASGHASGTLRRVD